MTYVVEIVTELGKTFVELFFEQYKGEIILQNLETLTGRRRRKLTEIVKYAKN